MYGFCGSMTTRPSFWNSTLPSPHGHSPANAGLWPWGDGSVEFQKDGRVVMLPQKPYIPNGTLRRGITYPAPAEDWDEKQIGKALDQVGLSHLKDKIGEE